MLCNISSRMDSFAGGREIAGSRENTMVVYGGDVAAPSGSGQWYATRATGLLATLGRYIVVAGHPGSG